MKTVRTLASAFGVLAITVTATIFVQNQSDTRSAGPVTDVPQISSKSFDRAESTALFVGVKDFAHNETPSVPYAVDDAIDLAHKFSLGPRTSLVPPRRVVLALSGSPEKPESAQRLSELKDKGAHIEKATSGDILNLLKAQIAQTGPNGIFVLSIATHGFLDDNGDPYILGSTSSIGTIDDSLRTATLFDIAGRATRSLIFVDACRDRVSTSVRGEGSDEKTVAPFIRKMGLARGQVIFYAAAPGTYAYDDPVRQNGVFTAAVLDGLCCKASAPHGEVIVSTLHTYVDREVSNWLKKNNKPPADPATQISMEGRTRNMPLSQCWRPKGPCSRVAIADSSITVYDDKTNKHWTKDLGERVVQAEVTDLDGDALCEVVVGLRSRIVAFDRDGNELWTKQYGELTLQTFITAELFRKHTNHIVAVWNDTRSSTSRLAVIDPSGSEQSSYEHDGTLQHVAVARPTSRHLPRIVATADQNVFVLESKKTGSVNLAWSKVLGLPNDTIESLRIVGNEDSPRDISVSAKSGTTVFDFEGKIIRPTPTRWKNSRRSKTHQDEAEDQ